LDATTSLLFHTHNHLFSSIMPCLMDAKVVAFYRDIYADLTVDREEAAELNAFLAALNPPPDKLLWIRAAAFRIAAEFLSEDSKDANVSLLRTVNYLVHAVEANCMVPKELDGAGPVDTDVLTEFYTNIFADHQLVSEENAELVAFFKETSPPDAASMTTTRALAFKTACENLSDENDKEHNVQLLRCVNAVVHAFELTCLTPKPFELHDEGVDLSMGLSEAVQHVRVFHSYARSRKLSCVFVPAFPHVPTLSPSQWTLFPVFIALGSR
jgi:hypothetical protein